VIPRQTVGRNITKGKVVEYFDKMSAEGYYGDPITPRTFFWKLGLDYGSWFASHLDEDRLLHPDKAKLILEEVLDRRHLLKRSRTKRSGSMSRRSSRSSLSSPDGDPTGERSSVRFKGMASE